MAVVNSPYTPPNILFAASRFAEYKTGVSEKFGSFSHLVRFFKRQHCTIVVTKAGRSLDAPRLPYRILCAEQLVKDASRTETVETDSLSQTHAHEGEE